MWKIIVAASLAGLIASLGLLFATNLRHGAPFRDSHAQIEDVFPGSPADRAGMLRGDIVLAIDGVDVPMNELKQRVSCGCAALATRTITVLRDDHIVAFRVRAENRRIGIHFGQATRYTPNLFAAARTSYRAWQQQAYAPAELLAAAAVPCPFGQRHILSIHSAPHRTAAVTSLALFWTSLAAMVVGFSLALRRRHQPAA